MTVSPPAVRTSSVTPVPAGWLALLLAACVTAAIVIAGDYHLFFVDFMFPTGDAASNDILITDAKHLALLHGNYSRVGFYHPGPFYLQWMAFFELAFVDGLPIFASPFAAHLFGLAVLHAGAIGLCFYAWQRLLEGRWLAGLAVAITVAATLTPIGQNYFVVAWPPYMYVPSALIVASGIVGLLTGDVRWLPVLLFGLLQLVHGHASFIGLVPAMMAVAVAFAAMLRVLPFGAFRPAAVAAFVRANRRPISVAIGVLALFVAPVAANTWLNWPGEIPKYFAFAGAPRNQDAGDALKYVAALIPWHGLWLLAFILPASRVPADRPRAISLRAAGVILAATGIIPAWLYAWRGIDTLDERYLIFWMLPLVGASLAAAIIYAASRLPAPVRMVTLGVAAVAAVIALGPFRTANLEARRAEVSRETQLMANTARAIEREIPRGHRLALQMDGNTTAWTRAWPDVAALIAALHRQGIEDVCLEQSSWHLLFHLQYRCSTDTNVSRLLYVTTPERATPGWRWELAHAVLSQARAPGMGTTAFGNALSESGIVLFGDWSGPEPWGVWSTGRRASFGLDASRLPARFHLEVEARVFPPRELADQKVRVVDASGRELATLSNRDPRAPLLLSIDRGHDPGDLVIVSFVIDSPVSPLALGVSTDDRALGVGLETITIKE